MWRYFFLPSMSGENDRTSSTSRNRLSKFLVFDVATRQELKIEDWGLKMKQVESFGIFVIHLTSFRHQS